MKEREILDRIRAAFPDSGIGDDTAVLPAAAGELLLASDAVVENVHFTRRRSTLSQAIQKAVTSNVSDVYAMGGRPEAILLSAGLPPGCSAEDVDSIVEGLAVSCGAYGLRLAGGDTVTSPGGYFFDVAIAGSVPAGRAVRRSGARAGDAVVLLGEIGPSLAGLSLLAAFLGPCVCGGPALPAPRLRDCAAAGARVRAASAGLSIATGAAALRSAAAGLAHIPRVAEMLRFILRHLAPRAEPAGDTLLGGAERAITAMIDVSDGLAKDLRTLCEESGVGAEIDAAALPVPRSIGEIFGLDGDALVDFALASGEEYVLLAAVREGALGALPPGAAVVGRFAPAHGGIVLAGPAGRRPLPPVGYEHSF